MIDVGSDYSGIGAFNQALNRLGIPHRHVFACDMDRYARQSYIANYLDDEVEVVTELPKSMGYDYMNHNNSFYFPKNVYDRAIPADPLNIYMTSPPCQAFSIAGKRDGEEDDRGILFYNSHEFIKKNKPRFFIFENVKGLLSHDKDKNDKKAPYGRTFNKWLQYLGGKSINGNPVMFPYGETVPYHIYYRVLNATDYGVPQNRERVFIVGIRDDVDNDFTWPKPIPLKKRLIDVLEDNVPEKYFLSEKMLSYLYTNSDIQKNNGNGFTFNALEPHHIGKAVTTREGQRMDDNFIKIKSATKKGYEEATAEDSINFSVLNSETRRGRVGKGVAHTLDTACNQGVMVGKEVRTEESKAKRRVSGTNDFRGKKLEFREADIMTTVQTGLTKDNLIKKDFRIRRLTPRECLRLMDFPNQFKITVSDTQAYKQAGNSIVVAVLEKIIKKLPL